jgi:hypothetical protein
MRARRPRLAATASCRSKSHALMSPDRRAVWTLGLAMPTGYPPEGGAPLRCSGDRLGRGGCERRGELLGEVGPAGLRCPAAGLGVVPSVEVGAGHTALAARHEDGPGQGRPGHVGLGIEREGLRAGTRRILLDLFRNLRLARDHKGVTSDRRPTSGGDRNRAPDGQLPCPRRDACAVVADHLAKPWATPTSLSTESENQVGPAPLASGRRLQVMPRHRAGEDRHDNGVVQAALDQAPDRGVLHVGDCPAPHGFPLGLSPRDVPLAV